MSYSKVLIYFSILSSIAPILIGAIDFKKTRHVRHALIVFILVIWSFAIDTGSNIVARVYNQNYWVINLYFIGELILLILFFKSNWNNKKVIDTILILLCILFAYQMLTNGIHARPNIYVGIHKLSVIALSLFLFYKMFKDGSDIFIENSSLFWLNVGILMYYSFSFFTTVLASEILTGPLPWSLHNLANILKNIFFAIGLWKARVAH